MNFVSKLKLIIITCLLISCNIVASYSLAKDDIYLVVGGGAVMPQKQLDGLILGGPNTNPAYLHIKRENFAAYRLAFGKIIDDIRAEIEYMAFTKRKLDWLGDAGTGVTHYLNAKLTGETFMFNVYYDLVGKSLASAASPAEAIPYIGLGLGAVRNKLSRVDMYYSNQNALNIILPLGYLKKQNKTALAWNVNIGARVDIKQAYFLDLQYRLSSLNNIRAGSELIKSDASIFNFYTPVVKGKLYNHALMLSLGILF